jgi:hypothetical protein
MKFPFLVLLFSFKISVLLAQSTPQNSGRPTIDYVQEKNFYLLTLLQHDVAVRTLLENDPVLAKSAADQTAAIKTSLNSCKNYLRLTTNLELSAAQVKLAAQRLSILFAHNVALQNLVKEKMIPSGAYSRYNKLPPAAQLVAAWQQDAKAIDSTIAVYAEGKKPRYPEIDSISFNIRDPAYIKVVQRVTAQVYDKTGHSRLFFLPALTAALAFLEVNGRDDAGNYEPMANTVNKAALEKGKTINWKSYKYTVLMVPGEGPENSNTPLSEGGMERCKLAASIFLQKQQKLAPFIMVSGGKVHPYKTRYCEAEEMKKYLVKTLHVPDSAILMEPHARHTTTNLRNTVRLLIQYHFPADKPALIVTDVSQLGLIAGSKQRCINELGYVPYRLGSVDYYGLEFFIVREALQVNPTEPLDP